MMWSMNIALLLVLVLVLFSQDALSHAEHGGNEALTFKFHSDTYVIPERYHAIYHGGDDFRFYLHFPQGGIIKAGPTPDNNVSVLVRAKKLRSEYTVKRITSLPASSGKLSEFDVYHQRIGTDGRTEVTYYIRNDNNGFPIVITHVGRLNLRVYRAVNKNLEFDYVFSKELKLSDWERLDKLMLDTFNSFRNHLTNASRLTRLRRATEARR